MGRENKSSPDLTDQERADMERDAKICEYTAKFYEAIAKLERSIARREQSNEAVSQRRSE